MSNTRVGVSTSSTLPAIALTSVIAISRRGEIAPTGPISFRNAHTLAVAPGRPATLDVALAILAGHPSPIRAASLTNVPPPARRPRIALWRETVRYEITTPAVAG